MSESERRPRKEDFWHMLYPLSGVLTELRQDWHDLEQPENEASELLTSSAWLEQVRKWTALFGRDTFLDGRIHGPVRWTLHSDKASFDSAPGEKVGRFEGIDTTRPWFAIGLYVSSCQNHLNINMGSWLYVPPHLLYYYMRALEEMSGDVPHIPALSRMGNEYLHNAVARACMSWVHDTDGEGPASYQACYAADTRSEFEHRAKELAEKSVAFVQAQEPTIDLLDGFKYGVYKAWAGSSSQAPELTECHTWMSFSAE